MKKFIYKIINKVKCLYKCNCSCRTSFNAEDYNKNNLNTASNNNNDIIVNTEL